MSIDKVFVLIFSGLGILFTYWYFLLKQEKEVAVSDSVDIIVNGGYSPTVIAIPLGKTTKLSFTRTDTNSCLEEVILSDFKIKKYLPLHQKITVEITPEKKGTFDYACAMNMFHGKIVVK